jgi:hypothetical protein
MKRHRGRPFVTAAQISSVWASKVGAGGGVPAWR